MDATLDVATDSLDHVLRGLREGQTQLATLRSAKTRTPDDVRQLNWLERQLASSVMQRLGPQVGNPGRTIAEVHDAAIVLQSLLSQANELPLQLFNSEQVQGLSDQLSRVEDNARDLGGLLAQLPNAQVGEAQEAALSRTDAALTRLIATIVDFQGRLADIRAKVEEVQGRVNFWLGLAPILIPLGLAWIIAGQLSLLVHGWSWLRSRPSTAQ